MAPHGHMHSVTHSTALFTRLLHRALQTMTENPFHLDDMTTQALI